MNSGVWLDDALRQPVVLSVRLAAALVLTVVSGVLVAAEAAVTRVISMGLPQAEGAQRITRARRRWERVAEDPTEHLNVLLFLRVVCEVCAVLAAAVGMLFLLGAGWPALLSTAVVMIAVVSSLVAITPRILGRQFPGQLA